jgi:hypothetical protein|tara:strand:+ start:648 stop:1109 length:462 start_codon:yes stop_codon:yes gene_type:complete
MKRLIIFLLLVASTVHAEKIERLGFYNLQEILEDDNLTYKIIKGCVSINSAVTELIKEEHPDLAKEFFKSANYLYPFGILVLKKIKNISHQEAEKEYFFSVDKHTNEYINFMKKNGNINKSFFKGTFLGDDLNFCNEIRAAIETTITETNKTK